jgi:AraC-like DNA-binding protein
MKEYDREYAQTWYFTPGILEKLGGMWLLRSGHNIAKKDYEAGPKVITSYGFHVIEQGALWLKTNGVTFRLEEGDIFCLFPNQRYHYGISDSESNLRMIWFVLEGPQVEFLLEQLGLKVNQPYRKRVLHPIMRTYLYRWLEAFEKDERNDAENGLWRQTQLYIMMQMVHETVDHQEMRSQDWLTEAVNYMDLHYMESISVAEVAKHVGRDRAYLSSRFMKAKGLSPKQYIIARKMESAKSMLNEGKLSITDIALTLGYPDLYSFSRSFRNHFGQAPSSSRVMKVKR